jgi:hypothetical protein
MIKAAKHAADPAPKHLVPFGPYGAGSGRPIRSDSSLFWVSWPWVSLPCRKRAGFSSLLPLVAQFSASFSGFAIGNH